MIKKISLQLLVADIERSIEFCTKELGFTVELRYEDFYAGIIKDGSSIHLKEGWSSMGEIKSNRSNEDPDIIFSVEGIEDVYEEMIRRSIKIIRPLRSMPYGKEFYVADPDDHIIAF